MGCTPPEKKPVKPAPKSTPPPDPNAKTMELKYTDIFDKSKKTLKLIEGKEELLFKSNFTRSDQPDDKKKAKDTELEFGFYAVYKLTGKTQNPKTVALPCFRLIEDTVYYNVWENCMNCEKENLAIDDGTKETGPLIELVHPCKYEVRCDKCEVNYLFKSKILKVTEK